MNTFQYGKVVSLKLPYADCPSSRDFYCIDKATVGSHSNIGETNLLPEVEKIRCRLLAPRRAQQQFVDIQDRAWVACFPRVPVC